MMWLILDTSWASFAQELLTKLEQNLPFTIATTIAMSLILTFWRKLLHLAKRQLGLVEPPKDPLHPALPEGEYARIIKPQKFHHGFTVDLGWRGALIDAGVVQRRLDPRRYRRREMKKLIARLNLGPNAQVVLWRDKEFPVVLFVRDLFASDHQPMQLDLHTIFRIDPARLLKSSMEEIAHPPQATADRISARIALPAQQLVATRAAAEFYNPGDALPAWIEMGRGWVQNALDGSAFELVRITDLRLSSPALDRIFKEYGDLALDSEAARREAERNKVRGALRQAVLAGKLEEVRDQSAHEEAVRVIEQERKLKDKALQQELSQADLNELEEKVNVWRRKHEMLMQILDPAEPGAPATLDLAQRVTENFRRTAVESGDSPFSAHERERIRTLLQSYRGQARPDEILAAIAKGGDIPCAIFDPLARIRGAHTLRVGDGWQFFDGDSLWQIRLTRIITRRHGFLWHRESPAQIRFEMRGSPDNRRYDQDVNVGKPFHLTVGTHEIPVEVLQGTPSSISLRIKADGDTEKRG